MKKILFIFAFVCFSLTILAQTITITKPVSYQDTTLSKCFCKYITTYSVENQNMTAYITVFGSKKSFINGSNAITVPEIPQAITIDLSLSQTKTLAQLNGLIQTAIKQELKSINDSWTNADIKF